MKHFLPTAFLCLGLIPGRLYSQNPQFFPAPATSSGQSGCNYAGTFTLGPVIGQSNSVGPDTIFLGFGDSIFVDHNGDQIFSCDPGLGTTQGIGWALYQCPPTLECDSLLSDPCFWPGASNGVFVLLGDYPGGDAWFFNSGALCNSGIFGAGHPVQIYYAPVTLDDPAMTSWTCFSANTAAAFSIVYLEPVLKSGLSTNFGDDCKGKFRLRGGFPEWDLTGLYSIDIALSGHPEVKGLPYNLPTQWKHGNDIIFSVPEAGTYEVDVRDGKNCGLHFQVDMNTCNPADNLTLSLPEVKAKPGSQVCLPLKVKNSDFLGAAFSLSWDSLVLHLDSLRNLYPQIEIVSSGTEGKIGLGIGSYAWPPAGVSIPDDETMFELCFTVIGAANTSSPVVIGNAVTPITFDRVDGSSGAVSVHNGRVDIRNKLTPTTNNPPGYSLELESGPGPVDRSATLVYQTRAAGAVTLLLCDLAGRVLLEQQETAQAGSNRFSLAASPLPAGWYVVFARDASGHRTTAQLLRLSH